MRPTAAESVANFYAAHRAFIIILQVLGLVAAALLGAYAWRLRTVDRFVAAAGMIMAVCGLAPGLITLMIAIVANPDHPAAAGRWNALEPRGDDILFVGIVLFAGAIAVRLGRRLPALGVLAALVALSCLARLVLEAAGRSRGPLEAVAPLLFVVLVATMAVLSFLGILRADSAPMRWPKIELMIMNNELADELAPGVRRMLAAAEQRGIAVELRRRPAANSLEEAAELLGIRPSEMAKTIVVRRSRGSYLFALIPGGTQIAWPKLRSLLGVSKMKLPDAAEALEATGYERGTITPIGSEQSWPVIIDQRLAGHRAALGAGGHGYSAFVEIDDLVRAYGAAVADIAD